MSIKVYSDQIFICLTKSSFITLSLQIISKSNLGPEPDCILKPAVISILKLSAGILFLILNILIWINGLIIDINRGMDIIPAVFLLAAGVLLIADLPILVQGILYIVYHFKIKP